MYHHLISFRTTGLYLTVPVKDKIKMQQNYAMNNLKRIMTPKIALFKETLYQEDNLIYILIKTTKSVCQLFFFPEF